jgi:hypothetical protein
MGQSSAHPPVVLLLAVISRYGEALSWAADRAVAAWGPIAAQSEAFDFTETDYYDTTMGMGLRKQFLGLAEPILPERLPEIKRQTNAWEQEYAALGRHPEPRPLNLDPGYLTAAKLVLASTKDHAHRLYLGQGIYGEITLTYRHRQWQPSEWTYPDYRRADFQAFFTRLRDDWRQRLREERAS